MKRIFILLALIFAVVLTGCADRTAEPVKPEQEALRCYQALLDAAPAIAGDAAELQDAAFGEAENRERFGQHYDQFALVDLNRDGIPELIASTVINFRWVQVSVFTYADGEAVLLKDPLGEAAHATIDQNSAANGAHVTYFCGDDHIHSLWRGTTPMGEAEENHAFALEGTALTAVDCAAAEGTFFHDLAKPNTPENTKAMLSD